MARGPADRSAKYDALRDSRRVFARAGRWLRWGLLGVGGSMFVEQARPLLSDAQFTWAERWMLAVGGIGYLVGFGLASWFVGRVVAASSDLIEVLIDQAEASARAVDLVERQAIPLLARIAQAAERPSPAAPAPPPPPPTSPAPVSRLDAIDAARRAIRDRRWGQADRLVKAAVRDHPGADSGRLLADFDAARQAEADRLRDRAEALLAADDPMGSIDARDDLTQVIRGDELVDFDRDLVRKLIRRVQARVKAGSIRADLAELAARVVDTFDDVAEVAPLRSLLPHLRRSSGLCPICGQPDRSGSPRGCPDCLASGAGPDAPAADPTRPSPVSAP